MTKNRIQPLVDDLVLTFLKIIIYRISSFKRRDVYKIPRVLVTAFVGGRRLLVGDIYIFVNVSLYIRKGTGKRIKNRSYFGVTVNKIKKVQIIKPLCHLLLLRKKISFKIFVMKAL